MGDSSVLSIVPAGISKRFFLTGITVLTNPQNFIFIVKSREWQRWVCGQSVFVCCLAVRKLDFFFPNIE